MHVALVVDGFGVRGFRVLIRGTWRVDRCALSTHIRSNTSTSQNKTLFINTCIILVL